MWSDVKAHTSQYPIHISYRTVEVVNPALILWKNNVIVSVLIPPFNTLTSEYYIADNIQRE
jgi:hypothetical protein